jgi:hypothetical protein
MYLTRKRRSWPMVLPQRGELERAGLGVEHRHLRLAAALRQPGPAVLVDAPRVHRVEHGVGLVDGQAGALGEHLEVAVRHDRGDLHDDVAVRLEAGHLEVQPDQRLLVRGRHGRILPFRAVTQVTSPFLDSPEDVC